MASRPAEPGTWRGALWVLVVATDFFLMSNPLVLVVDFDSALRLAVLVTVAAVVVTVKWVRVPKVALPVLAYLGWTFASLSWSILPAYTSDAWAQSAAVASVAVLIYANVGARVLATGFVLGGVAACLASFYAFHERMPGGFFEPLTGPVWAGIGRNPNILAYTLTLALCGVCAWLPRPWWARLAWVGAIVVIAWGLSESASSTGGLAAAAVVITAVLLAGYGPVTRRFIRTTTHRVLAVVAAAAVLVGGYSVVAKTLGQDLITFSDRTPLWEATLYVSQERPIAGFGWGAVWQHPWKPSLLNIVIDKIWTRSGLPLPHGHNSVIDLIIEVGIVGVVLMLVIYLAVVLRAVTLLRTPGSDIDTRVMGRFTVLCLVNLVVFGITEPMATIPLGWWALVLLTGPVERARRGARRRDASVMM